jgi:hypothetical protein
MLYEDDDNKYIFNCMYMEVNIIRSIDVVYAKINSAHNINIYTSKGMSVRAVDGGNLENCYAISIVGSNPISFLFTQDSQVVKGGRL